jgi:hypothetical protein
MSKESTITSPLKKWPFNQYAYKIHDGWDKINQMMAEDPKMSQQEAFPIVFRIQYKKTTVCKYKLQWYEAPESLCDEFVAFGRSAWGSYAKFDQACQTFLQSHPGHKLHDDDLASTASDESIILLESDGEHRVLSSKGNGKGKRVRPSDKTVLSSKGKRKEVRHTGKNVIALPSDSG